jgi:hypothetical protein
MARMAQVMSLRPGQVFVREMLAALTVGDYAEVPDALTLSEPGWTLFCLDLDEGEVVFVQTGLTDLSAAPFCYQAQYQGATSVLRMTSDAFLELGAVLPRREPAIHLFNIGHCGSTLLHAVLNGSGSAFCISEPLFTFQLALARHDLGAERISASMGAGLGFLGQFPGAGRGPLVVKHSSQATTVMAGFQAAEPQSKSVVMDRRAQDWCASVYGLSQRMGGCDVYRREPALHLVDFDRRAERGRGRGIAGLWGRRIGI